VEPLSGPEALFKRHHCNSQGGKLPNNERVLIAGGWRDADATGTFRPINPATGETLEWSYPVSRRADIDIALEAGSAAANELLHTPVDKIADFLEHYAHLIGESSLELSKAANLETALPVSPRFVDIELPRTIDQLRQAATAARDRGWTMPTIDTAPNIRSMHGPLGAPVAVFGPNNFPFAYNAVAGGDFAAAIAVRSPVIAKVHPSHPRTSQLLAEVAFQAIQDTGLPPATLQMVYHMAPEDGFYLVSHSLIGATGYTGSRRAGLALKAAADAAGKPIYLEMSSVNPVFILPGALRERGEEIVGELHASAMVATGQFCTNPGVVVLQAGDAAEQFIAAMRSRFEDADAGVLLGPGGVRVVGDAVQSMQSSGAELVTGGAPIEGGACRFQNTLLQASGEDFLADPEGLQEEAFGNANLFVVATDDDELEQIAGRFAGNLTGCLYTHSDGDDDLLYERIAPHLRRRVGRLLNDKMPTGVLVVPSMNHGGPYPATGHPGFTAVGIPASLLRFSMLQCYDEVREHRLPVELRDQNPTGNLWRSIDGAWTQADVMAPDPS
jgi:NADP-dependent aldehyde dehydrogenase